MFRTSFSRYLTAFVVIIFVSFVILSFTITSMVRDYAFSETEERLNKECSIVVDLINEDGVSKIEDEVFKIAIAIEPMVNLHTDYDVMITDKNGKIILSTAHSKSDEEKTALVDVEKGMGDVPIVDMKKKISESGEVSYVYNGPISKALHDQYMVYAKPIYMGDEVEAYVISLASTDEENEFVSITRRVVINSAIWVMLAAVIAAYFITPIWIKIFSIKQIA